MPKVLVRSNAKKYPFLQLYNQPNFSRDTFLMRDLNQSNGLLRKFVGSIQLWLYPIHLFHIPAGRKFDGRLRL